MVELTKEQAQAMAAQQSPLQVVNPLTQETFFLIRKDVHDLVCNILDTGVWLRRRRLLPDLSFRSEDLLVASSLDDKRGPA